MAEEQNHTVDAVAVPEIKDEAAPVAAEETPATETAAAAPTAADAEDKPAEDDKPAETEETGAAKEEVKPIEEGSLSYKAQGLIFPKNFVFIKTNVSIGADAVDPESLTAYKKTERHTETAQHNISWASSTGKGLLLFGDKKAPSNIINLSTTSGVEVDGTKTFFFIVNDHKHSFKAATEEERDGWVKTLKENIVEAKGLAATVPETETYKKTMESFKPVTPAAKEDKPEETNEGAKADAPTEDAPKEEDPAAAAGRESKADEPKEKSHAASRKRISFFNLGSKKEEKVEAKEEEATTSEAPVIDTVPEVEAPATEGVPAAETSAEDKPAAEEAQPDSPKDKVTKRKSLFGGVFSKKEKKSNESAKTEEAPIEEAETTDTAPVIPHIQATDPFDVSSPVAAPIETVESPVTATEPKKDTKEKRKGSLPFGLGKRDTKDPAPASESTFSRLRATIKGKGASKAEEKSGEEAAKENEAANEGEPEAIKEETDADAAAAAPDATTEAAPKIEEAEPAKEDAPAAPVVTASA